MSVFKSLPIFKKQRWRVVKVSVMMDSFAMDAFAFNTAGEMLDKEMVSKIYYARYGDPHAGTTFVEFKLIPLVPDKELETYLRLCYETEITKVTITPFEGSDAHAEAFVLARMLRGTGDEQIGDVVHWLLNMSGLNYLDEIRLAARSTYTIADTLQKQERG